MSHNQLTLKQRFRIESLLEIDWLQKDIANQIGVNPGTISREISRNGGAEYDARKAHAKANQRRKNGKKKSKKLFSNEFIFKYTEEKLKLYWSPEQIAGRLRYDWGEIICHETIYEFIYEEKKEWKIYLRQKKGKYRRRHGTKKREKEREEAKKKRIEMRPSVVEERSRIGDWEGDTIVGGERTTGIITHVERSTGYLLGDLFKQKNSELIKEKIVKSFAKIDDNKKHTITYDNGTEFSEHEIIERKTKMDIYFANAYHSWERGTNENTNGLLRQFFPKKSMFAKLTQKEVNNAVDIINHRPRKRLGYLTPYEVFMEGKSIAIQARM